MTALDISPKKKRLSFNESGVQFAWDATSISLAETCLRKYQYRIIEGWRSNGEGVHLRFGKHFATALEHYYKHVALGAEWEEALVLVVEEAMEDTFDFLPDSTKYLSSSGNWLDSTTDAPTAPPDRVPWTSLHAAKNRENLIRTIVWYVDQFHAEEVTVMMTDGKPAVEYSFALPVDDGIIFTGHIDRVVEFVGDPYVMDQKTTAQTISPYWFNQFKPHTQFSMYTFAGKAIWHIPVKGVIIDGAQINVGFSRFERSVSMRTDEELMEFYEGSMAHIQQAQKATLENHFPMRPASCGNYGGCEFRTVCSRSPSLRENFLKGDFNKSEPWDPLERR